MTHKRIVLTGTTDVLQLLDTTAQPLVKALDEALKAAVEGKDPTEHAKALQDMDHAEFVKGWMKGNEDASVEMLALVCYFASARTMVQRPAAEVEAAERAGL
jgi:hypothetical protein